MKVFREMFLRGESEQLVALMSEVEKSLPPGWKRYKSRVNPVIDSILMTESPYRFEHSQDDFLPSATVYLDEKGPGCLSVSNIRPHTKPQLTYDEYNSILELFCDRIVRPCAEKRGVRVELTACHANLSDWLSGTAVEKLRTFSTTASRNTGSVLPTDQERWFDFIITAHNEGSELDASTLRRWLIEDEGWSPEIADHLAGEYAFGGRLLSFTERVGA
jgi:hypothetical protein